MKRFFAACAAVVFLLSGCSEIIEKAPENITSGSTAAEAVISSQAESLTEAVPSEIASEIQPEELPDLFAIFSDSDSYSGRIADNAQLARQSVSADHRVSELTPDNISQAAENDALDRTLFYFTADSCDGIIPSDSDDGEYYAGKVKYSDTEYVLLFGKTDETDIKDAERYISNCSAVDYFVFCTDPENNILVPVAAGNDEYGIYVVIPAAEYLGFDMSHTRAAEGIPDSFGIRVTGLEQDSETGLTKLYYRFDSRFEKDVVFICTNIYLNGESIAEKSADELPLTLDKLGRIQFSETEISLGDGLYFYGTLFDPETNEEICTAGAVSLISDSVIYSSDE